MEIAKTIYADMGYEVTYTPDIVFAHRETGDLTLQLVTPRPPVLPPREENFYNPIKEKFERWGRPLVPDTAKEERRFPLIVDCPGSGWAGADGHRHIPYLVDLARNGFAAAGISYRGTYRDNVVFPAAVQDLKEAVRFLRANAGAFHIDPDRVGLLGDSSGGNTVAMAALADGEKYDIGEHLDISSKVSACCCVYGPVDLLNLVQDRIDEHKPLRPDEAPFPEGVPFEAMEIWQEKYLDDPAGFMREASPYYCIHEGEKPVPFQYIIGDDDPIIPMAQGLRFCEKLRECGGRAELIKVAGGEHGNGVWTKEMMENVIQFFKRYL